MTNSTTCVHTCKGLHLRAHGAVYPTGGVAMIM